MRLALAPLSRLASRGARRAGKCPLAGARPVPLAPGVARRSPGSGRGSRPGSAAATGHNLPHAARVGRPGPRRSTGGSRDGDEDGRASDRTGNGAGGTAVGLRTSLTSQVEVTRYPISRARAQDASGMVRRTELRRASLDGETPEDRSLTVTTAVVAKGDDVEGVAAMARRHGLHPGLDAGRHRGGGAGVSRGSSPLRLPPTSTESSERLIAITSTLPTELIPGMCRYWARRKKNS